MASEQPQTFSVSPVDLNHVVEAEHSMMSVGFGETTQQGHTLGFDNNSKLQTPRKNVYDAVSEEEKHAYRNLPKQPFNLEDVAKTPETPSPQPFRKPVRSLDRSSKRRCKDISTPSPRKLVSILPKNTPSPIQSPYAITPKSVKQGIKSQSHISPTKQIAAALMAKAKSYVSPKKRQAQQGPMAKKKLKLDLLSPKTGRRPKSRQEFSDSDSVDSWNDRPVSKY